MAQNKTLTVAFIETPLGKMFALSDTQALFLLKFIDDKDLQKSIDLIGKTVPFTITNEGTTPPLESIKKELGLYFAGKLQKFTTPINMTGTPFQQKSWQALQSIPYGKTISYGQQAHMIQTPLAHRAIANANGKNLFVVLIPCHRVISSDGNIGGYNCGTDRKNFLIELEAKHK